MEFPDVTKVERLTLRPGDRLVLSVDHELDDAGWAQVLDGVRRWGLPEGSVIVLEAGLSLQVLAAAEAVA